MFGIRGFTSTRVDNTMPGKPWSDNKNRARDVRISFQLPAPATYDVAPAGTRMSNVSPDDRNPWAVFLIFLRLGATSFGGPIAHIGYFHEEFVTRRRWLSERSYADLVALCQFLPGPSSSQIGMALGLTRCGYIGALLAWVGFTLPSAIIMILVALGISSHANAVPAGVLHGLKVVAVAVVAQAVWGMARILCRDALRIAIMLAAACVVLAMPGTWAQIGAMLAAGGAGLLLFKGEPNAPHDPLPAVPGARSGATWLALFLVLLAALPVLVRLLPNQMLALVDAFYRTGALVFGGGHVAMPLLQAAVVPSGWVGDDVFLIGYGVAQAIPGPLFSFAAFLGASMNTPPSGWIGGAICLVAIFAPSFLLVAGVLPFWERLRGNVRIQAALAGINAAVVGLLLAALYQPVWKVAIQQPRDIALASTALAALMLLRLPAWLVVIGSGAAGWLLHLAG
jgi:chromate transporter